MVNKPIKIGIEARAKFLEAYGVAPKPQAIPVSQFKEPDIQPVTQSVNDLNPYSFAGQTQFAPTQYSIFDGEKYPGGFGPTQLQTLDYWTMRKRSSQLFNDNLYARGLIRRLITNEINTGLSPEATPEAEILKPLTEDFLNDWSELIETRFSLWSNSAALCDYRGVDNFGAIQRTARREALIEGDVLVVLRQSQKTKLPTVQLINGGQVRSPLQDEIRKGHTVKRGVEKDSRGMIVAYWVVQRYDECLVTQQDKKIKRIPAFGEKSGRRIAWLEYGTDKRVFEDRGVPLLAIILQSLKEIDRYRDSAQRKAVVNSILAMFIYKKEDKMGTLPMTGSAVRKDSATVTDGDGSTRDFNITNNIPGVILDELQTGEEPKGFQSQGTDINFPVFEEAVIAAIAWANEIPPEILRLSFSNNYSASQAAINEFKIYLNLIWNKFGFSFCKPIYIEWLLAETLLQKIKAPNLLESWRDPTQYDIFAAWTSVEWYGSIKPSTDMLKQTKGSKMLVDNGWSNNAREARGLTGTKFTRNVKRLKHENKLLVDAISPVIEMEERRQKVVNGGNGGSAASNLIGKTAALQALENTEEILNQIEDLTS